MTAKYQSVILAAGRGSRLAEHTQLMPKALLPIGPRSHTDATETNFLRRQVELLHDLGVSQIVIVVGSLRQLIIDAVATWDVPVQLVVNPTPDIGTSGSLHSFQFAVRAGLGILDGRMQTLLHDADIVYHRDALKRLLDAPAQSSLLACERHTGDNEEVRVYGPLDRPRFLGKALTPALVAGEPLLGEATGIVKFAPEDHALARETIDWFVGDPDAPDGTARQRGYGPARAATEHEELTQRFMRYGRMRCVRFGEEIPFMECDDAREYEKVRTSFYPRLLELEAQGGLAMTRPMILLNPGPANTTDSVKQALICPDICPREPDFGRVLSRVRDGVTRVVHSGSTYTSVLLGGSGTAAVEAAISSSVPVDGRLLVIDNGAYGARVRQIAEAYGIAHDVEAFGVGGYPDLDRIEKRLRAQRYTQLAVIHHETSTGVLNPVEAIGKLCREYGAEMIVDAMSSYAGIPIDVEHMGADFLVSSSNKCIQGMAGLAFVICKRERLEQMQPISGRSYYLSLPRHYRFFQAEQQMLFTPPVQVVSALAQALDEYFAEGGEQRHARYMANWEALDGGMLGLGFRRLLPEAILSRILTCYVDPDHPRYEFGQMHDRLYAKGFTIYPGKGASQATFRLANMGAVDSDDMRAFIAAMRQTIDEMGITPLYSK